MSNTSQAQPPIAVIGMAGRFPGAADLSEFWQNITHGHCSVANFAKDKKQTCQENDNEQPSWVAAKGVLAGASMFDADFFRLTEFEALTLDPQYRVFLELAWSAMEIAGYGIVNAPTRVGVFSGSSTRNNYYINNILNNITSHSEAEKLAIFTRNAKDFLATLVGYKLNLTGPCVNIQTACSTAHAAIATACDSIRLNHCDIALAGAISITTPLKEGYLAQKGMTLSTDGVCRPFDQFANGTVAGNGGGILVLKSLDQALKDRDTIHAVIKGYALNNDGNKKLGFAAPSVQGQVAVIRAALSNAGIKAKEISYIEAHGTATPIGDRVEISALSQIFNDNNALTLGSVKGNIGHLDVAAGIAGCMKTILALKHKSLPPTAHFSQLNPSIPQLERFFNINSQTVAWPASPSHRRYAGVSAFGIGGTNAHIILEEPPPELLQPSETTQPVLLVLSASVLSTLVRYRRRLAHYLDQNRQLNLKDVAFTLQQGRKHFNTRYACICCSIDEAINKLIQVTDRTGLESGFITTHSHQQNDYKRIAHIATEWLNHQKVPFNELNPGAQARRVPLVTYPFESREFWLDENKHHNPSSHQQNNNTTEAQLDQTQLEQTLCSIFKKYIGRDHINSSSDFYRFGGDSLLALQVLAEIKTQLNIEIDVTTLHQYSSPKKLTQYIIENHAK